MGVWMIWVRGLDDGYVWLAEAWTDDMTADNSEGWREVVDKAREDASVNGWELRIQRVTVPGAVELFDVPEAEAITE